jgi:nucleotide-binding universal stress UspA family protein
MMIHSILAATDLDSPSVAAARWALDHLAPRAEATLLYVIDPPDRPSFGEHLLPPREDIESAAREHANARLRDIAEIDLGGIPRYDVRSGRPHEVIVEVAAELNAGVVVIGPHGGRPRPHKFLGTTAERVARSAPAPVLIGTNPPSGPPRRILVPVDDADITPVLLDWTRLLAEQFDAEVKLLHVWSNAAFSHVASITYATARSEERARTDIGNVLRDAADHWLHKMVGTGIAADRLTSAVTYGNAGERALEVADSMRAELIIVGRTGAGLVRAAFLGSTVGTILHGARCPVLVITNPARTGQSADRPPSR